MDAQIVVLDACVLYPAAARPLHEIGSGRYDSKFWSGTRAVAFSAAEEAPMESLCKSIISSLTPVVASLYLAIFKLFAKSAILGRAIDRIGFTELRTKTTEEFEAATSRAPR